MITSRMVRSAYVHIPFCSHKCDFCDFAAFAGLDHLEDEYTNVLCAEIEQRLAGVDVQALETVFYGGGTPGLVKPETIARIQSCIRHCTGISSSAEVSLETTPHSITKEKASRWLGAGINRISVGIESLNDDELRNIGRDHTQAQALSGVDAACAAGFENVSCDFMYALPTQTLESWRQTLEHFVELANKYTQIKHVSSYGLHLANNSPLFSRFPKGSESYPADEVFEQMYQTLVETLSAAGFFQYEVSNFARPGFESSHNMAYWKNHEYYGFGVSAHRYVGGVRSSNWRSLARYMKDYMGDETKEIIDAETRVREAIMLGLRMRKGIELATFAREFGYDFSERHAKAIAKLESGGFIVCEDGHVRITDKGVPVSNDVICELL